MFERFTEKARRVIFFARYEASRYGSSYIETEHILLGLLKEDPHLLNILPARRSVDEIRRDIEKRIDIHQPISTSVEVPLSAQSKKALNLAAEAADRLASQSIGHEHLLLALLRIKDGLAAKIIGWDEKGLGQLREKVMNRHPPQHAVASAGPPMDTHLCQVVESFLTALRGGNVQDLEGSFSTDCCFVDAWGKLWRGQKEIVSNLETLLAPFAKRSAKLAWETPTTNNQTLWVTTLVWEDVHLLGFSPLDLFRMCIVFAVERDVPAICLLQITPIGREASGKGATT